MHPRVVPEASCACKGGHPRLGSTPLAALEYVLEADKERHPPRVRFLGTNSATYRGLFTMPDTRCESKELLLLVSARWSRRGRGAGGEERWKCWPWGFGFFRVSRWGFAVIADPPPSLPLPAGEYPGQAAPHRALHELLAGGEAQELHAGSPLPRRLPSPQPGPVPRERDQGGQPAPTRLRERDQGGQGV